MVNSSLEDSCLAKVTFLFNKGIIKESLEMSFFDYVDLYIKMGKEKELKDSLSDKNIDYNDEIISIEDVGEKETIDITVTGDNLFYCNDILTKNSFGTGATADLVLAISTNDEMERLNRLMIKQLKNRYADTSKFKRFYVGVDKSKMRIYDIVGAEDPFDEEEKDRGIAARKGIGDKFSSFNF